MDPQSNDRCLCKKRRGHRDTQRRRAWEDGGRDGVMHLQVKERQGWPGSHQKLEGQDGLDVPSEPPEGINPVDTLTSDFRPPELGENKFPSF